MLRTSQFWKEYTNLLKELIALTISTDRFSEKDELGFTSEDSYPPLITLTRKDLIVALQKFLKGDVPPLELHYWANLIEGRDTIEAEENYSFIIHDVIRYLADTTDQDNPLTPGMAEYWIERLKNSDKNPVVEAKIMSIEN